MIRWENQKRDKFNSLFFMKSFFIELTFLCENRIKRLSGKIVFFVINTGIYGVFNIANVCNEDSLFYLHFVSRF